MKKEDLFKVYSRSWWMLVILLACMVTLYIRGVWLLCAAGHWTEASAQVALYILYVLAGYKTRKEF